MAENKFVTPHNPLEGDKPELVVNLHNGSNEQISVIVVHKDRPEYLNITLQTIAVCTPNSNYEIIVVDNASTSEESKEYLAEVKKNGIKVVDMPKNAYWSEACNAGVNAANKNTKYFIFLHSDVAVTQRGWIDLMIQAAEGSQSGLVGVSTSTYQMNNTDVQFIEEWCMLVSRECFNDIGPWPVELPMIGHAFLMTIRAQFKNWKPQIMQNKICHHYAHFSVDVSEWERLVEQATVTLPKLVQEAQSRTLPQTL
jgi:GT2 family glycosyltransferase